MFSLNDLLCAIHFKCHILSVFLQLLYYKGSPFLIHLELGCSIFIGCLKKIYTVCYMFMKIFTIFFINSILQINRKLGFVQRLRKVLHIFEERCNQNSYCVLYIVFYSQEVSMIRKYHNHRLNTNPQHREEELQDSYSNKTSKRQ